jgi:hypothetical protein
MIQFSGRVTVSETRAPIPNLMVRILSRPSQIGDDQQTTELSLGSDVTLRDGTFSIDVASAEEAETLQIFVTVSAPETGQNNKPSKNVLYRSEVRGVLPTAQQTMTIRIDAKDLEGRDLLPSTKQIGETVNQAITDAKAAEASVSAALSGRVKEDVTREATFDTKVLSRIIDQATTSAAVVTGDYAYVVGTEEEKAPGSLARNSISAGIQQIQGERNGQARQSSGPRRRTRYFFNDNQLAALDAATTAPPPDTTFSEIGETTLFDILDLSTRLENEGAPTEANREQELFNAFLVETREEACMNDIFSPPLPGDGGTGDTDDPTAPALPATQDDVLSLVSEVIDDVKAPLAALTGSGGEAPGLAQAIQDFALPVGPADQPRVFDFSSLDVAFDDVWQVVTDQRLEPLARALYVKSARVLDGVVASAKLESLKDLTRTLETTRRAARGSAPGVIYKINDGRGPNPTVEDVLAPTLPEPLPPPPPRPEPELPVDPGGVVAWPGSSGEGKPDTNAEPEKLVDQIDAILREPHAFTAFGADARSKAINFGLVVGYRHIMTPVTYQVGDLVKTVTLGPNESREYSTRTTTTRKRAEKEVIKHNSIRRDELSETNRTESEIVRKALAKTNFSLTSDGTYNLGLSKGTAKTASGRDGETASNEVKKGFREAVLKASEELRRERSMDVSFESEDSYEETSKGRIENPNNELTLTYLFFELQRRFRVNETIQKATPVILVAQDVPSPDEINNTFLVRYAWVLKRALLDDSFVVPLDYVQNGIVADRLDVLSLGETLLEQRRQSAELRTQLVALEEQAGRRYEALLQAVKERLAEEGEEESDGFFSDIGDTLFGGGQETGTARLREEAARDAEERAAQKAKNMAIQLQRAVNALNEATEAYNRANNRYHSMSLRVAQLRIHVKENILYYMQAIWSHEVDDQRFLRLYRQPVPQFVRQGGVEPIYRRISAAAGTTKVKVTNGPGGVTAQTLTAVDFELVPSIDMLPGEFDRPLVEVADPSRLLGFLGNYMIFPMTQTNALTDLLLNPYLDEGLRLLDPHDPGNITRPEFARYICDLRERLSDAEFDAIRGALSARYRELLLSSEYAGDEIVVPSGSLYMEALPGKTPLLESFKLAHRAFDLVGAQEEARRKALDNLRLAARLVEGDNADPETDARYDFFGAPGVVVPTDDGPGGGTGDGGPGGGG